MAETIKKPIRSTLLLLKLIGLWTDEDDFFGTRFYWKYSMFILVALLGTFNLCQFVYLAQHLTDMELMAKTAYLTLTFVMPNVKAYFYLKNFPVIKRLVHQLDQEDFQPKNPGQELECDKFFGTHLIIRYIYAFLAGVLVVLWPLLPLFGSSAERRLPFLAWYPYDWKEPTLYIVSYVHQGIGVALFLLMNIGLDLVSFGLTAYVGAECDILADTLRNMYEFTAERLGVVGALDRIGRFEEEKERHEEVLGEMNNTLIECIHHHRKLLKFAEDTNTFLNFLVFSQFASSLLSICLTMFELTVSTSVTEIFTICNFQCALFSELLFYCYWGNEAVFKSVGLSQALFDCRWTDCSEEFRKNLLFFMMRTQRPIRIIALNFFILSLPTCTSIIRMSWSFFAMLYQTHNEK